MSRLFLGLSDKDLMLVEKLVSEDGENPLQFVVKLIHAEDRRRHIQDLPMEDDARMKCTRRGCFESRSRGYEAPVR